MLESLYSGETALIFLAFLFGGFLKGATGVGTPLLAVPLMVMFRDVAFAVAVFALPNLLPNLWQAWRFRAQSVSRKLNARLCLGGALGSAIGIMILVSVSNTYLTFSVAAAVAAYVILRLAKPSWRLDRKPAETLAGGAGLFGGILQSSAGIGAPVSLTFVSSMRLEKEQFIFTISLLLASVGAVQLPFLIINGLLTAELALLSLLAMVPLTLGMIAGRKVGGVLSHHAFEKIILALLIIVTIRMVSNAW